MHEQPRRTYSFDITRLYMYDRAYLRHAEIIFCGYGIIINERDSITIFHCMLTSGLVAEGSLVARIQLLSQCIGPISYESQ